MEHEAQLLNWTAFLYAWAMESVGTIEDKLKLYFTVCDQVQTQTTDTDYSTPVGS